MIFNPLPLLIMDKLLIYKLQRHGTLAAEFIVNQLFRKYMRNQTLELKKLVKKIKGNCDICGRNNSQNFTK